MINKLTEKIRKTHAPIVVGLDPMLNYIPKHIQDAAFKECGETLEGAAEAVWQFNKAIVDATHDLIPAVKPQIAMYEQFGIPGLMAFKKTVDYCKEKDLVVIGDIKRGDIGSTSAAYAAGHIGRVQVGSKEYAGFDEDFVTVNPYLGSDGVNPFIDVCKKEKKGLFILVKTSNPSSGEFQDQLVNGRPLYELVGEKVAEWGQECMGDSYSYIGAVVGATYPEMGNKLTEKIRKTHAPIVVGLDPMLNYIPKHIQDAAFKECGETLEGAAEAVWQFNKAIVDATHDLIPAVKPQIAMYEQFGIPGLMAFKKTVDYCKEKDLVVIGDIKRGDIGSTSAAYAAGHIGRVQVGSKEYAGFDEDFVTVNPYLGSDGVNPFIDVCKKEKKGLFILVKTSNPSSGEFQDQLVNGRPLYELVGEKVAEWGQECMGDSYSYIGAVVGATYPEMGKILRRIMPKAYILVPGYGAQGGQGKDLVHFFNEDGLGAIVNSSRGIIAAYKQEKYAEIGEANFADASRRAVEDMIADIDGALKAVK